MDSSVGGLVKEEGGVWVVFVEDLDDFLGRWLIRFIVLEHEPDRIARQGVNHILRDLRLNPYVCHDSGSPCERGKSVISCRARGVHFRRLVGPVPDLVRS